MRYLSPYTWSALGFLVASLLMANGLWVLVTIWWMPSALWVWSLVLGPWLALSAGLWSLRYLPTYWKSGVVGCTLVLLILTIRIPTFSTELYAITFSAEWAFWVGTFLFLARSSST